MVKCNQLKGGVTTNKAFQVNFTSGLHDLNPKFAGEGAPTPGAYCTPSDDSICYLIHYILSGKGTIHSRGQVYTASAGQAFLCLPHERITYVSDPDDPWFYRWVGFTGELSHHFEQLPPVLDLEEDPFPSLKHLLDPTMPLDYMLAGDLFHLYCKFLRPTNRKQDHIQQIIDHIQKNYMHTIAVEDYAKQYGLDRRYLSRQFKKRTGYTIRGYITEVRMNAAKHYIRQGYSGKEVAQLCGFSDTSNFYKVFKQKRGMNPSEWCKQQENETEIYQNRD